MNRKLQMMGGAAVAALAVGLMAGPAGAGGFALHERSAAAQGASFAGADAGGDDITFAGFNPATLGNVERGEIGGNLSGVFVSNSGETFNVFTKATSSADPGEAAAVPALAAGYRLADQIAVGVTVNSGFGLVTEYPNNALAWPWAAAGLKSDLMTITTTPIVAWSPTPQITVAGGPQIHYLDAELTRAVGAPGTLGATFPASPVGSLEGDTWEFGWQVGALFKPMPGTAIGVSYTAGYDVTIDGDFTSPLAPVPLAAKAETKIPDVFGVGIRQDVTDRFRVMGEFQYYDWSDFQQIGITITGIGDATELTKYDDSIFIALGAEYDVTDRLTVRAGGAYDETPTTDAFRSVRVPDADRWWISAGLSYDVTDKFRIDLAYSLLLAEDTTVKANGVTILSDVNYDDGMVHIFSVGASLKF